MRLVTKFLFIIFAFSFLPEISLGQEVMSIKPEVRSVQDISKLKKKDYQDLVRDLPFQVPLLMQIDSTHTIQSEGITVLGKILKGKVSVSDEVSLLGNRSTLNRTVTKIYNNRKVVQTAKAGDVVGLVLRGVIKKEIKPGMIVISPGTLQMHKAFRAEVTLSNQAATNTAFDIDSKTGFIQIFIHSTSITTEYFLPMKSFWKVDEKANVIFDLNYPVGLKPGMKFSIRSAEQIIGSGVVGEILF